MARAAATWKHVLRLGPPEFELRASGVERPPKRKLFRTSLGYKGYRVTDMCSRYEWNALTACCHVKDPKMELLRSGPEYDPIWGRCAS